MDRIVRVYNGDYNVDNGNDGNTFGEVYRWPNLGEDKVEDWKAVLRVALKEVSQYGISDNALSELGHLIGG